MNTLTQTHTLEYVLDVLPHLRLTNQKGDIRIYHDAEPGVVNLRLHSHRPVSFDDVQATSDGTTVTVNIPQLSEADSGSESVLPHRRPVAVRGLPRGHG